MDALLILPFGNVLGDDLFVPLQDCRAEFFVRAEEFRMDSFLRDVKAPASDREPEGSPIILANLP